MSILFCPLFYSIGGLFFGLATVSSLRKLMSTRRAGTLVMRYSWLGIPGYALQAVEGKKRGGSIAGDIIPLFLMSKRNQLYLYCVVPSLHTVLCTPCTAALHVHPPFTRTTLETNESSR
jgi:hypothetical protein